MLNNSLGISFQSKPWLKIILQHYNGYHLVYDRHGGLWGQVITSGIQQLHRVKLCTSPKLINDWHLPTKVTPLSRKNQVLIPPPKLHHLMESTRDGSIHMDERPSQKKVVTGIYIQYLELCAKLYGAHLKGQIHCPQRVSLNPIKSFHIDLVLLQFPKVKP